MGLSSSSENEDNEMKENQDTDIATLNREYIEQFKNGQSTEFYSVHNESSVGQDSEEMKNVGNDNVFYYKHSESSRSEKQPKIKGI